ncbi:RES family NAD+ phosphorylase [Acerihabitans sp. TG2]|uniref:RES family NAD+ phosphorylase n=1 Tax=Acerihabitans sp. TG2 TaxID=3096008 RepID=UPI002B23BDE2|nr:RES family NAD+ phosphorylase [Acerihabitans sp. TG2]MEA9392110.1 RES family NAD+ phosphorylase [Acerihabitans sp. TG2]
MIVAILDGERFPAFYRVIVPAYATTPCSGMGAARQGGRFNRPRQEALYLSVDEATALAEYQQDNPWLQPGMICTFFAKALRVADLSAGYDSTHWADLWADFAVDWRTERFGNGIEPPTWYMADDVVAAGLDGILFPSQAYPGGINLVIYRSSQLTSAQLCVYDPASRLQDITPNIRT